MRATKGALSPRRFATDAVLAFSAFTLLALLASGGATQAATLPLAATTAPSSALSLDFLALAAVFSVILAFNMAFFRHLRQAYAVPRGRRATPKWSGPSGRA